MPITTSFYANSSKIWAGRGRALIQGGLCEYFGYDLIHTKDSQKVLKRPPKSLKVQGLKPQGLSIVYGYNIFP